MPQVASYHILECVKVGEDMAERMAAEAFLPGEYIAEELGARGLSRGELADILGKTTGVIDELIKGKRQVSPEIAGGLSAAFGTSVEYWTNLEAAYQSWRLRKNRGEDFFIEGESWRIEQGGTATEQTLYLRGV
jgi:HTH-type transcriptional regulator/antitoxin HigA